MSINQLTNLSKDLRLTSIILIIGISLSLFILSCGSGIDPQLKVNNPEAGQFAANLTLAPPDTGTDDEFGYISPGSGVPESIKNAEVTVEAWVKPLATGSLEGSIYFRGGDNYGIMLYVRQTVPRFALQVREQNGNVPFVVNQGFANRFTTANQWYHIAGILSSGHAAPDHELGSCTTGERSSWHLDFYLDGQFADCNVAGPPIECVFQAGSPGEAPCPANNVIGDFSDARIGSPFNPWGLGVVPQISNLHIDELRVWKTARTGAEINECMNTELSVAGGSCGIDPTILKGYWKFNDGAGTSTADHSGSNASGSLEYCDFDCFGPNATHLEWNEPGIWVSGYPFP